MVFIRPGERYREPLSEKDLCAAEGVRRASFVRKGRSHISHATVRRKSELRSTKYETTGLRIRSRGRGRSRRGCRIHLAKSTIGQGLSARVGRGRVEMLNAEC